MKNKWPVKWTSRTIYVDIDTAERITKHQFKTKYTKIKTDKYATFTNTNRTKGQIEYTILARNRRLQELPFNQ